MTSQRRSGSPLADLDLIKDGLKLVTLTSGINLYTGVSFYDYREGILGALDLFQERCPPSRLQYYATETMRAHKPVTKRALAMPQTWLKPGAPHKEYVALELKSGDAYQDAPECKYHIWAVDKSKQAKVLSLAFPAVLGLEKPDEMLALVQKLAEILPFTSGLAGLSFERSPYSERESETHAWTKSMRHPGVDIVRLPEDAKAAGTDAVRGVGWLTLLGTSVITQLGGMAVLRGKLGREIALIESKHGVIVKAGPAPTVGDVNRGETLPLYREVYRVCAPLIATAASRSMVFRLPAQRAERTQAWYARLSD